MRASKPRDISEWIQRTYRQSPERVQIRTRHIEMERIWREIMESDIRKVLENGKVHSLRTSDMTIFWRGVDSSNRNLELQCAIASEDGVDTLLVQEAKTVRVGTAYDPNQNDAILKDKWLKDHPTYEELPNGKVQRRINITKG